MQLKKVNIGLIYLIMIWRQPKLCSRQKDGCTLDSCVIKPSRKYRKAIQPDNDPPYQHNLIRLVEGAGLLHALSEEQMDVIDELMPLNIEARYPSYKEQLEKAMTQDKCREIINNTKDLQQWIKNKL